MKPHEITFEDIDALLKFLPLFEKPGRTFARWSEVETNTGRSINLPFPVYDDDVEEFFDLVGEHGWLDHGYRPEEAGRMLEDSEFVERASLEQIKTMLTFCLRGERFCYGNWEMLLTGGKLVELLKRLEVIRGQM